MIVKISVQHTSQVFHYLPSQLTLFLLRDERVSQHLSQLHSLISFLPHRLQNEILCLIPNIYILRECYIVGYLYISIYTMRSKSISV